MRESYSPSVFDAASDRKSPTRARSANYFEESKRNAKNFRYLVLGIFISVVYDILWFMAIGSDLGNKDLGDGGKELWVREFSLYMAYLHFFVKIITAFVFWKTSLDFDRLRDARTRPF